MQFIFPADPLNPAKTEEHFAFQVRETFASATVDLYDLNEPRSFKRVKEELLVYRGWMLSEEEYRLLEAGIVSKGGQLLTSTDQYLKAHHLPNWYSTFSHLTPLSVVCGVDPSLSEINDAADAIEGPFIVKDFVKSRKHEWEEACYAPTKERLVEVVKKFVELQGDALAGGVIIRKFEEFTGEEARVWWVNGEAVLVTAHPDTPDFTPSPDLDGVQEAVKALGCPFVTTDMVRRSDGVWRVVEVGDGQVSDFPKNADFSILVEALEQ